MKGNKLDFGERLTRCNKCDQSLGEMKILALSERMGSSKTLRATRSPTPMSDRGSRPGPESEFDQR